MIVNRDIKRGLACAGHFSDLGWAASVHRYSKVEINTNKEKQLQPKVLKQAVTPAFGNENHRGTE